VTQHHNDLIMRPITGPDEVDLFNRLPYLLNDEVSEDLTAGRRRPQWLWVALRGDRVVARAGWWSRAGDEHPLLMDIFDVDGDVDEGVRLLETALPAVTPAGATPPEYGRFLPADWRDHADTRQAVNDRMGALQRVGPAVRRAPASAVAARNTQSRARRPALVPAGPRCRGTHRSDDARAGRHPGCAQPR